ncbi:MAG: DegV family protein [Clostridiales bacterium]|nr:DegV family protein [Clostridiales bacterium]
MKKTAIVTDSHSSISPAEAALLGVHVLPMPFEIDGQEYFEGVNITRQQFFGYQRAGAHIGTSQPAPAAVVELWDKLLEEYESLLYMPISSGLSNSCQTAIALAKEAPYAGRVFVVDNGRVGTPLHRSVLDAMELVGKGLSAAACKAALEEARNDFVVYIAVETLEHLKRGGRISSTAATVGTLLHIKPILQLATGKLESYKKARGMHKACEIMLESIRSDLAIRFQEAQSRGDVSLLAAGTADADTTAKWLRQIEAAFPGMPILYDDLSMGVSCHIGEGALGIGLSVRPHS